MENKDELISYLEAILNLQCDAQDDMAQLKKEAEQLLPKAREVYARVNGIQTEVEEALSSLSLLLNPKQEETPPAPADSHLLRNIGIAALLSPLIWNGIAAGVRAMQWWTGDLGTAGTLAMTSVISVAWGLLLMVLEPPLNRALQKRRLAALEEDAFLDDLP